MLFGVFGPIVLFVFKTYSLPVVNNFSFDVVLTEFLNVAKPKFHENGRYTQQVYSENEIYQQHSIGTKYCPQIHYYRVSMDAIRLPNCF